MLTAISILLTILFLCFCFKRPMAIPGAYLLLSNFFVMEIPSLGINTSKLFTLFIVVYFLIHARSNYRTFLNNKVALLYTATLMVAIIIPTISHYLLWGKWPNLYTITQLKGLWGLGLFFLPEQKVNVKELFLYLGGCFMASLVLISPSSLIEYFHSGNGLGRSLTPMPPYIVNKATRPLFQWFIMDSNTYENMCLTVTVIITYVYGKILYSRGPVEFSLSLLFLGFVFYIFYINQYLITLVITFFNLWLVTLIYIFMYMAKLNGRKNKVIKATLFLSLVSVFFYLTYTNHDFSSKFQSRLFIVERSKSLTSTNRISIFKTTIKNWANNFLLKGSGHTDSYEMNNTPLKLPITITGHSTFIDNMISFGLLAGFFANLIFLAPLYLLFFWRKRIAPNEFIYFATFFITAFILSSETIFCRLALQLGSLIGVTAVFIMAAFNKRKVSVGETSITQGPKV